MAPKTLERSFRSSVLGAICAEDDDSTDAPRRHQGRLFLPLNGGRADRYMAIQFYPLATAEPQRFTRRWGGAGEMAGDAAQIIPLCRGVRPVIVGDRRKDVSILAMKRVEKQCRIPDIVTRVQRPFRFDEAIEMILHVDLHAADGDVASWLPIGRTERCRCGLIGWRDHGAAGNVEGPGVRRALLAAFGESDGQQESLGEMIILLGRRNEGEASFGPADRLRRKEWGEASDPGRGDAACP